MPFYRVGDVLQKRRNIFSSEKRMVDALSIISAWPSIIKDIQCVEKFERTRALSFKNNVLIVLAASSIAAAELKMCEEKILASYEKRFRQHVVDKVVIRRN